MHDPHAVEAHAGFLRRRLDPCLIAEQGKRGQLLFIRALAGLQHRVVLGGGHRHPGRFRLQDFLDQFGISRNHAHHSSDDSRSKTSWERFQFLRLNSTR